MTSGVNTTGLDTFISAQNVVRTQNGVPIFANAALGPVPSGDETATGISGISAGAPTISLGSGYNAVVFDGAHATTASTSGPDNYAFNVDSSGNITVIDENTGNQELITGATYLVFNNAATTSAGAYESLYVVASGQTAEIAAMYNAAFQRQPDLPGLEFYAIPTLSGALTLHQDAQYFLASPEFAKDYPALLAPADNGGANDQAFINELYGNILHRTPTASEVNYYVQALQGSLTTSAGAAIPAADRAQLLIYFAVSPENQSDISGWLINPANGGYVDPTIPLSAQAAANTAAADNTINAADIASPTSSTYASASNSTGTTVIAGNGAVGPTGLPSAGNQISTTSSNMTIYLSSTYNSGDIAGSNDTIYSAPTGHSIIGIPSTNPIPSDANTGGTVYLSGDGNTINTSGGLAGITTPTTIYGFNATDYISQTTASFATTYTGSEVLTGSTSAPINGATIQFVKPGANQNNAVGMLAINVGTVANDTAATMVAAANAVYKVGDVSGEEVTFFGQDPSGNTVMFHWGNGDVNKDHLVDANSFTGGEILIGVQANTITIANFH